MSATLSRLFLLNNLAQKNYQRWRQVQDEIYRTLLNAGRDAGTRSELVEEEKSGVSYSTLRTSDRVTGK